MKKFIRGKILKIEDEYTVILDVSAVDGVEEGMIFIVYDQGDKVYDHKGKLLGNIEYPKAILKIINVSSKFSVAQSDEWYYDISYEYDYPDYDPGEQYRRQRKIAEIKKDKEKKVEKEEKEKKSLSQEIWQKKGTKLVNVGDLVRSKKAIN